MPGKERRRRGEHLIPEVLVAVTWSGSHPVAGSDPGRIAEGWQLRPAVVRLFAATAVALAAIPPARKQSPPPRLGLVQQRVLHGPLRRAGR